MESNKIDDSSYQQEDFTPLLMETPQEKPRYLGLDIIRIAACYMVMQIHAAQFYYSGTWGVITSKTSAFWVGIFNSIFRVCVPLFLMSSGYLLLPMKKDLSTFLKSRIVRVFIPFFVWAVLYSFYNCALNNITLKECFLNIPLIFVNYGSYVGHLWYIYMLLGVYFIFPIISPWIAQAPISHFLYFFIIWFFASCVDYIHIYAPIVWGECLWNTYSTVYYFSGYLAYAVFGAFVKVHLNEKYNLYIPAIIMMIVGYVVTTTIWEVKLKHNPLNVFDLELSWKFTICNVGIMSAGFFLLFRKIQSNNQKLIKICQDVATKTYGMYLAHMMILNTFHTLIDPENKLTCWFSFVLSILTFVCTYIAIKLISFIPFSKYIIG